MSRKCRKVWTSGFSDMLQRTDIYRDGGRNTSLSDVKIEITEGQQFVERATEVKLLIKLLGRIARIA